MNATNVASTLEEEGRTERGGMDDVDSSKRVIAASCAAVVSSFVTTPLDVVKTRMQTHSVATFSGRSEPSCSRVNYIHRFPLRRLLPSVSKVTRHNGGFLHSVLSLFQTPQTGCMHHRPWRVDQFALCHCISASPSQAGEICASNVPPHRSYQPSMVSTIRNIYKQEGMRVLWRGLDTSILLTVPMVSIYMPLYDVMRARMTSPTLDLGVYAPAAAGSLARVVAVVATAPLDLIRTRQQALTTPQPSPPSASSRHPGVATAANKSTMQAVLRDVLYSSSTQQTGPAVSRLWAGVGATIARDVPFTIIYWSLLEPTRKLLLEQHVEPTYDKTVAANLFAGAGAGTIAAIVTTPADVMKTRLQTSGQMTSMQALRQIYSEDGFRSLMRGWAPRAARTAPACAIVIASYELIKTMI